MTRKRDKKVNACFAIKAVATVFVLVGFVAFIKALAPENPVGGLALYREVSVPECVEAARKNRSAVVRSFFDSRR